ncbi:MAG TPA: antibiotic biosynthesis monooxygenase [Acidimicrobiales bacterium]|nr:antibiotic biosynthesis monooxygenase [Acidimicrobiales bacterium]
MSTAVMRMFQTAVDPADLADVRRLFADDILPVFRDMPGCVSMELVLSVDHNPGGLLECAAVSRWETADAMDAAMASRPAKEAQVRLFELLRQEPVVRVFEVLA